MLAQLPSGQDGFSAKTHHPRRLQDRGDGDFTGAFSSFCKLCIASVVGKGERCVERESRVPFLPSWQPTVTVVRPRESFSFTLAGCAARFR